jgi:IclR family transcriptional regulator, acetate operon repressor
VFKISESERGGPVPPQERDYSVRAVERVCSILNLLQQAVDGVSLVEVAETTELPKSSAFRYLWTLEAHRYVERDPGSGLYRLGLGFLGMQSRQLEVLRERTRPWLEKLRDELGETVNLGILDGDSVIYLDIVESRRGVRLAARRGERDPIHSTALGKAIAATLPEARVRDILHHAGMPRRTANTITAADDYLAELAKVRRIGYAVDNGENEVDGRCVAVPIPGTRLPAALSLSAPAARFPLQQTEVVAQALHDAAGQITTEATSGAATR